MSRPIYLDHAATTPVDPRVAQRMLAYLTGDGEFGNPASRDHVYGHNALEAVEQAREAVAALVGAQPREIVWTSGATEANNLALRGAVEAARRGGRHLVTSKTEHRAVLDVCNSLERTGCEVSYLDTGPDGIVDTDALEAALRPDTVMVSIMHVNNETGVIQDLAAIGALTRSRGILLHVDAAQGAGKLALDLRALPVDLMSLSAHKVYGPKGVGALFVRHRPRARIQAQILGGGQERGLRAGTLATHQVVGMGEAFRLAREELAVNGARMEALGQRLRERLEALGRVALNGHPRRRYPGILNLSFAGVDAEALMLGLRDEVAVSTGAACASAQPQPSHVLRAMGCPVARARGAVRFSLGRDTTVEEVERAARAVCAVVERLRAISPLWEDECVGRPATAPVRGSIDHALQ